MTKPSSTSTIITVIGGRTPSISIRSGHLPTGGIIRTGGAGPGGIRFTMIPGGIPGMSDSGMLGTGLILTGIIMILTGLIGTGMPQEA
jgi:hypothetical protein